MNCRFCNYETSKTICPRCKNETSQEIPTEIYWCLNCKIPVIKNKNQAEDNAKNYALTRPFDDELVGMFSPFGKISRELGKKILNEVIVLDIKTNVPIISLQPFTVDGFEHAVKVKTMNVANHEDLQRQIGYQIRKFNACRKCLKCESVCKAGAIHISSVGYFIDAEKCVHCKKCVTEKYLVGGCMMEKYLKTKR